MARPYPADRALGFEAPSLLQGLADNWWLFLLRGIAAIAFGVMALVWPHITLVALTVLFGAFLLLDGILALAAAIAGRGGSQRRWWLAVVGAAGVITGALMFIWPAVTTVAWLMLIAAWAIVIGVFQIIGAIRLRKEIDNEWFLVLSGLLWIAFGALMIARPAAGAVGIAWIIATFAILAGAAYVVFALRLRGRRRVL